MVAKKGNAAIVIIAALFILFLVAILYIVATQPYQMIYNSLQPDIEAEYQPTVAKIDSMWQNWPIYTILVVLIWAIWAVLNRRKDAG